MKLLLILLLVWNCVAAEEPLDSTKVHQVGEVTVTSTRFVQNQKTSPLHYTVIDKQAMQSLNVNSLADVLRSMDGVTMREYAGNSGIKTISQRGMGSEHTVILLNGMRINVPQNSLLDFGLFTAESFDAVELISGGSSSLYGADAVAGAVNIITRTSKEPYVADINCGIGSFDQRKYSASVGTTIDQFSVRFGIVNEMSKEDYPFTVFFGPDKISSVRKNADFESNTLFVLSDGFLSERTSFSVFSSWLRSERGVPGLFIAPASSSAARQTDEDILLTGGVSHSIADSVTLTTQILSRYFYERYLEPTIVVGNIPVDNYFVNIDTRLLSSVIIREENGLWNMGGEFAGIFARGNSVRNSVERTMASGFISYERTLPVHFHQLDKIIVLPSTRVDVISQFPSIVSPSFAMSFVSSPFDMSTVTNITAVIRASVSKNYSVPTFNQLYYSGGGGIGNPDIRPEQGISKDAGASIYFDLFGEHEATVKYFFIQLEDRIVWVSAGSNSVTPKNLRETESEGMELRYQLSSLNNLIMLRIGYSAISARKVSEDFPGDPNVGKYLIYVPSETFTSSLAFNIPLNMGIVSSVAAAGEIQRIGFRYINEDNSRFQPSVTLMNMNLKLELTYGEISTICKFEINNITNQQYQILSSYPMPGRSFRFTTGLRF